MPNNIKYINGFNRQAYDRMTIMLPKGAKERIRAYADHKGMSMNEYLASLIPRALVGEWRSEKSE